MYINNKTEPKFIERENGANIYKLILNNIIDIYPIIAHFVSKA